MKRVIKPQTKQKDQHRRSVETLGLSDHGDGLNIPNYKLKVKIEGSKIMSGVE